MSDEIEFRFDRQVGRILTGQLARPVIWTVEHDGQIIWRALIGPSSMLGVPVDVMRLIDAEGDAVTLTLTEATGNAGAQCGRVVGAVRGVVIRCGLPPHHDLPHKGSVEWNE